MPKCDYNKVAIGLKLKLVISVKVQERFEDSGSCVDKIKPYVIMKLTTN